MKRVLLFTACCCTFYGYGQMVRTPLNAAYIALNTYSSQFKDALSFTSNAASLAGLKRFSAGLYSERRFMLQELSAYSFAAALPSRSGNFGLSGSYSGGGQYKETLIGLAYARGLGPKADIGVQFHYFSMKAAGYGSASAVTFNVGAVFHLTESVQTGISIYNPVGMKIGKSGEEKLPSIYSAGIGYDVSKQLFISAEIQKTENQPLTVNTGLQYLFADKLFARGGISSAASISYIGFGVALKNIRVDVTASFHPYLGVTPGLLLIYSAK